MLAGYRYLRDQGHTKSSVHRASIDKLGQSVPWLPYPATELFEQLLRPSDHVLEIGGGHSTRWLSGRVESVTTIEPNSEWAATIEAWELPNVEVVSTSSTGGYDVIIIDGPDNRIDWLEKAERSEARLIVFDNWDRYDVERNHAVTVSGIAPGVVEPNTTAFLFQQPRECIVGD